MRTVYGNMAGANRLDWPITLQELEPLYARTEDKLGVTGTSEIPRLPGNNNLKVMAAGAKRLGYTQVYTGNMAINSQPREGRPACRQSGFCMSGCTVPTPTVLPIFQNAHARWTSVVPRIVAQ